MRAVYKYVLRIQDAQVLEFPCGARFMRVDQQGSPDEVVLWMLVDPSAVKTSHWHTLGVGDTI